MRYWDIDKEVFFVNTSCKNYGKKNNWKNIKFIKKSKKRSLEVSST